MLLNNRSWIQFYLHDYGEFENLCFVLVASKKLITSLIYHSIFSSCGSYALQFLMNNFHRDSVSVIASD